jgi:hypothetical protein
VFFFLKFSIFYLEKYRNFIVLYVVPLLRLDASFFSTVKMKTNSGKVCFFVEHEMTYLRANTFLTKEPETCTWIDEFDSKSVFLDVGANGGAFSLYGAQKNMLFIALSP